MDYEEFIFELMDAEPAVLGGAVIDAGGNLMFQTENWDLQQEMDQINAVIADAQKTDGSNPGKLVIMEVGYMIVELTPERIIATNVAHKGHVIIGMGDNGSVIAYIDPNGAPRDALFNVQTFSRRL